MRYRILKAVTLVLAVTCFTPSVEAGKHVRVILDTSKSMRQTDRPQLAPLATLLLYDLATLEVTLDDSFEVIPFHESQKWGRPSDPAPTGTGPIVTPAGRSRVDFARQLRDLATYEAEWTYFYPGLLRATADLENTPGAGRDVRVIVLITDGVPEAHTRDRELRIIHERLSLRMATAGIQVHVLAFGHKAQQHSSFFKQIVQPPSRAPLGELFLDRDGNEMLQTMTRIFNRSFGFTQERIGAVPGVATLDLEGGLNPDRVAVTVFSRRPAPPRLDLAPPPGGSVNSPRGLLSGRASGASYSLRWLLSPQEGPYRFSSDLRMGDGGKVSVLRPTRLDMEVRPAPPLSQTGRAMAGKPFPLLVLVTPATGAGDPGAVNLSFKVVGSRDRSAPGGSSYLWERKSQGPQQNSGTLTPAGRIFKIHPVFPIAPQGVETKQPYIGHIEIDARRPGSEAIVAALQGPLAHRVEVYPHLAIHPVPSRGDAHPESGAGSRSPALNRGETGCARFHLEVDGGKWPEHSGAAAYPLRAAVADTVSLQGALSEARFTLDGLPLTIDGRPGPYPGEWYRGRSLGRTALLTEHTLCVRVGKPMAGTGKAPVEVPVTFTFQRSPYDDFGVVEPFTLVVRVAPPTFTEKWAPVLITATVATLLLGGLWYLRFRPVLPEDLRIAVGRTDAPELTMSSIRPRPRSSWARLLGATGSHAVELPGEGRLLGHLIPNDEELFRFRSARKTHLKTPQGGSLIPPRKTGDVAIHRTYHLSLEDVTYRLRLEYLR